MTKKTRRGRDQREREKGGKREEKKRTSIGELSLVEVPEEEEWLELMRALQSAHIGEHSADDIGVEEHSICRPGRWQLIREAQLLAEGGNIQREPYRYDGIDPVGVGEGVGQNNRGIELSMSVNVNRRGGE